MVTRRVGGIEDRKRLHRIRRHEIRNVDTGVVLGAEDRQAAPDLEHDAGGGGAQWR